MTAPLLADAARRDMSVSLCYARTADGEPLTSRGRLVVGTPGELCENLGNLLVGCTIDGHVDQATEVVYVTEWAVGR